MALLVTPTGVQKLEFDVTTAEGPCHITIVTGFLSSSVGAFSNNNAFITQSQTITALIDPTLTPGQFRKATATAGLSRTTGGVNVVQSNIQFSIDDTQATLDDETGKILLRVDVTAGASNGSASLQSISFQVTTLSKI